MACDPTVDPNCVPGESSQLDSVFSFMNDHPVVSIVGGVLLFVAIFGMPNKGVTFGRTGGQRQPRLLGE